MSNLTNKRIFLTGAAGFSGSGLVEKLLQMNVTSKPDPQAKRCLDVRTAETESGFFAETTFMEGLRRTIQEYKKATNPDVL
jgi:nucleoside-diphosphate-sugar epimerase